jgi:serine/threonine protein phosphatase PrpC
MKAAVIVLSASGRGQDRALSLPLAPGYLVAIADGAGGTGGGAAAAQGLIDFVSGMSARAASTDWFAALCTFDQSLSAQSSGGQTTGVVAFVAGERIVGASVGDSAAWLISSAGSTDLTARQRRKPLLGSGGVVPVQFESVWQGGRLLFASDGLIKYAPVDRIRALAVNGSLESAADALANCVRLPSGALQDDVAIVLAEA